MSICAPFDIICLHIEKEKQLLLFFSCFIVTVVAKPIRQKGRKMTTLLKTRLKLFRSISLNERIDHIVHPAV